MRWLILPTIVVLFFSFPVQGDGVQAPLVVSGALGEEGGFILSWTPPVDADGLAEAVGYVVTKSVPGLDDQIFELDGDAVDFTDVAPAVWPYVSYTVAWVGVQGTSQDSNPTLRTPYPHCRVVGLQDPLEPPFVEHDIDCLFPPPDIPPD